MWKSWICRFHRQLKIFFQFHLMLNCFIPRSSTSEFFDKALVVNKLWNALLKAYGRLQLYSQTFLIFGVFQLLKFSSLWWNFWAFKNYQNGNLFLPYTPKLFWNGMFWPKINLHCFYFPVLYKFSHLEWFEFMQHRFASCPICMSMEPVNGQL